jgi:aminopeptidase N
MRRDPHSYADDAQPRVTALDWTADVDFATRTLTCTATLQLAAPAGGGPLDLDTRDLTIEAVEVDARAIAWDLAAPEPILGARLRLELPNGARAVTLRYRTAPTASALQWLTPAQTAGGAQPFLFSQCQAIHARSIVPVPDTPRSRITYTASLTVPRQLRALMAARHDGRRESATAGEARAIEMWTMPQPIPPYLLAFAVGDLASRDVGPRSRVWAEPATLEAAAWEFAGVDTMLTTAETLFGPYDWERFDILTMPPSFPYGGMENPRLTFLTPTLLAGDRSLVSVVAHELAHSWTGNLVTNASAEHFWLNEGFTVFAERRIVAALWGDDACALQAALGWRSLHEALDRFETRPELTKLHTQLAGIDPDESFSQIPYEKGYLFLRALEEAAGRPAFDRFLRAWVAELRFSAVDESDFRRLCERELPGALAAVDGAAWLDGVGVPPSAPRPHSRTLAAIESLGAQLPPDDVVTTWGATEWTLYLEALPRPTPAPLIDELERRYALTASRNDEVLVAWLLAALAAGVTSVLPRVGELLARVGRMKYLRPLYAALAAKPATRPLAESLFARYRDSYHPIAQQVVGGLLARG